MLSSKHKSINPNRVNEIIKGMVGEYFVRKNEEMDGKSRKEISEVKSLLDLLVEENRIEMDEGFKMRLFEFLRHNLIANVDDVS